MSTATDNAYARISTRVGNARQTIHDNLQLLRGRIVEYESAIAHGDELPIQRFGDLAGPLDELAAAERAYFTARGIVESSERFHGQFAQADQQPPGDEPDDVGTVRQRVMSHIVEHYRFDQLFTDEEIVAALSDIGRSSVGWALWHLWRAGSIVKLEDVAARERNDDYVRYARLSG